MISVEKIQDILESCREKGSINKYVASKKLHEEIIRRSLEIEIEKKELLRAIHAKRNT